MAPNRSLGQTASEKCPGYFFIFCLHPIIDVNHGVMTDWSDWSSVNLMNHTEISRLMVAIDNSFDSAKEMLLSDQHLIYHIPDNPD